ncbi:hypothetical protein GR702_17590 [Novosphingobium sp. FGD1]|uniref:Uncharacterized protein n=1 Tax=Novosphingobium silvae TaxID=2692619 RepID=A0A7X4K908_9SPHN|nr:phage regulatory CII family protein [Novosphingobium silvae]MYL99577.1 hypothetical protein [Novosphingobium silvae]
MTPAVARLKLAVVQAISRNGGKDSAALTAKRQPSTVGRWHNRNDDVFPPVECAFELDQLCMVLGDAPPILSAMAAELGHVVHRLPSVATSTMNPNDALVAAMAEFGDIAAAIQAAHRDGKVCDQDCSEITRQIDEAQASLARLRALYCAAAGA